VLAVLELLGCAVCGPLRTMLTTGGKPRRFHRIAPNIAYGEGASDRLHDPDSLPQVQSAVKPQNTKIMSGW